MEGHSCNPGLWRLRQEDHQFKFKVRLKYKGNIKESCFPRI
jgi:hypothetical protein